MNVSTALLSAIFASLVQFAPVLPVPSARADALPLPSEQAGIHVYRTANPAVVTIRSGPRTGSGSIITADGLVLTNEHVIRAGQPAIAANAITVSVNLADGRRYTGQVIALDRPNDLALLQLVSETGELVSGLPTVQLAIADQLDVGERVYAIGSPFGLSGTLTTGILSRIDPNGDLQTDASLNPGNSGGPLLNANGQLIGVNKAIMTREGNTGIGFATSVRTAVAFMQQYRPQALLAQGYTALPTPPAAAPTPPVGVLVVPSDRPDLYTQDTNGTPANPEVVVPPVARGGDRARLGVTVNNTDLVIQQVEVNTPASQVGLRVGDRLVAINGQPLKTLQDLLGFLDQQPASAIITIARQNRLANYQVNF